MLKCVAHLVNECLVILNGFNIYNGKNKHSWSYQGILRGEFLVDPGATDTLVPAAPGMRITNFRFYFRETHGSKYESTQQKSLMSNCFYAFLVLLFSFSPAQDLVIDSSYHSDKTTYAIPGIEYEAGSLHKLFFGSHWRDLWTETYKIEVLDLDKLGGGLTPLRRGGGKQSKVLHFKGSDGIRYKFRSVNKDPIVMERNLEGAPAPGIVKDQTSSQHPFGSRIVASLQSRVGIMQSVPISVVMPDDPKLGKFRNDFKNILGTLEIDPQEESVPGSEKVFGTDKLLKRLDKEQGEFVDAKEFLKARLMDIFIGDWDRSRDQWDWAGFRQPDGPMVFKVIPKDRDQAFTKFDGLVPWIATKIVPDINNFGYTYPSIKHITWTGRHLDQHFLVFLDRREWDSIAAYMQSNLTDQVIENAVRQIPLQAYNLSKDELISKLKSRRNRLMEISSDFYDHVNSVADIFGTDKRDYVEIRGLPDGKTKVSVYKGEDGIASDGTRLLRQKVFSNYTTDEIRIYLQDGDDKVLAGGIDVNAPTIRIIGGKGKDELVDNSDLPVKFYDAGDNTRIKEGANTYYDDEKYEDPWDSLQAVYDKIKDKLSEDEKEQYEEDINDIKYDPKYRDRWSSTGIAPYLSINPDYGVLFGGSISYTKYGFRSQPNLYKMRLKGEYASRRDNISGVILDYLATFRKVIRGANTNLHLRYSGIEINNFFGFGNETPYNQTLYDQGYYNAWNEEITVNPFVEFPQDRWYRFSIGAVMDYFHIEDRGDILVKQISPYSLHERRLLLGGQAGVMIDTRDNEDAPYKGFYLDLHGTAFAPLTSDQSRFSKGMAEMRTYLYMKTFTKMSLALRVRGEKLWGKYPFYQAAFLGGRQTLRGFFRERFAGDASLLGGAELRVELFKLNLIVPGQWGMFGFAESGRVFVRGEQSALWHAGYGAGLYVYFINRDFTFSMAYAKSKERTSAIYFYTGFAF